MLRVYQSNQQEQLAELFADILRRAPLPPLQTEQLIVHSHTTSHWLSLQLADRLGICANVRFSFPAAFIWRLFGAVLPQIPAQSHYESPVLRWRIMALLRELQDTPPFAPVRASLADDGGADEQCFQLATRLGELFNRYLIYRPDWVEQWSRNPGQHWQDILWQRLTQQPGGDIHWGTMRRHFLRLLRSKEFPLSALPPRVTLFGMPELSPGYLEVLAALGKRLEVHLFVCNPCRQYWGDVVPRKVVLRQEEAAQAQPGELYFETGNRLLASLGRQGRDFLDGLLQYPAEEQEKFVSPGRDSRLHRLQTDILELREYSPDRDAAAATAAEQDDSIQIHVCHNPVREIEVLHDRLLHLFATRPQLNPSEVTVLIPQLEEYAPLVEGVFAAAQEDLAIPFSIAGWRVRHRQQAADTILRLLDLPEGRFGVREILALLECPDISARFGMEDSLNMILSWLRDSGIRWGWDALDRERLQLPRDGVNTWQAGLDSLLLGYALPDEQTTPAAGVSLPPSIEGEKAAIAGRLYDVTARLAELREQLRQERDASQWCAALLALGRDFLGEEARQILDSAARTLQDTCSRAAYESPLSVATVRSFVAQFLAERFSSESGSGVHFRPMASLQSTPCKLLCLVGMNDGAFPKAEHRQHFDRMGEAPRRRGDPDRRAADRYLFLECILSARELLYISYTGRTPRDNSPRPPSILVRELIDALEGTPEEGGGSLPEFEHPLQPFSRRYFQGEEQFFSYARAFCPATPAPESKAADKAADAALPLLHISLSEPSRESRSLSLDELLQFFRNPTRFLLRRRLGLQLVEEQTLPPEHTPFHPEGLEAYTLRARLLEDTLADPSRDTTQSLRAQGVLPPGQAGSVQLEQARGQLAPLLREVRHLLATPPEEPLELLLEFPDQLQLGGRIGGLRNGSLGLWNANRITPKQRLTLEIQHLVLCCVAPAGLGDSVLLGYSKDRPQGYERLRLPVVGQQQARQRLQQLLHLYQQGLRQPLHFFPKSSYAYAEGLPKGEESALGKAHKCWQGDGFSVLPGEKNDPYFHFVFHDAAVLDEEFRTLACQLFHSGEPAP